MLNLNLILALSLLCSLVAANELSYFKIDTRRITRASGLVKRDNSDDYVSLQLTDENTFYMAELVVGSNKDKVGVLLDTGSSDLWIVNENNTYCQSGTAGSLKGRLLQDFQHSNETDAGDQVDSLTFVHNIFDRKASSASNTIDCSQYGTFNPKKSTSFKNNGTEFSIMYADQTFANGTWGQDSINFNGVDISNVNFAVCDKTDNSMSVLGIGLPGLEVTAANNNGAKLYQYENLPLKLVESGIIKKAAYSVYLNEESDNGAILFGAIDTSKFTGDLVNLPIVNTNANSNSDPIQIAVTLNSLSYIQNNESKEARLAEGAIPALLDTGTTLSYMPYNVIQAITYQLDMSYSSSLGYYLTDCSNGADISFDFNFQGLSIKVPMSSFLISVTTGSGKTSDQCAFGVQTSSTGYIILGDSFLKHVYMVVDIDNLTVGLAKSIASSNDEILVIKNEIPQAKQPSSSVTYGSSNRAFTTVRYPYLSDITPDSSTSETSTSTSSSKTSSQKTISTKSSSSSITESSTRESSSTESSSTESSSTESSSTTAPTTSTTTASSSSTSISPSSKSTSDSSLSSSTSSTITRVHHTSISLLTSPTSSSLSLSNSHSSSTESSATSRTFSAVSSSFSILSTTLTTSSSQSSTFVASDSESSSSESLSSITSVSSISSQTTRNNANHLNLDLHLGLFALLVALF